MFIQSIFQIFRKRIFDIFQYNGYNMIVKNPKNWILEKLLTNKISNKFSGLYATNSKIFGLYSSFNGVISL